MKKEMATKVIYFSLAFILLILILGFFFPDSFLKYFIVPALSPFFPDFSPFNASISLILDTAPLIIDLENNILVCEDGSLSNFFNVSDLDRNLAEVSISPISPFFAEITSSPSIGEFVYGARIFSAVLGKSNVDRTLGYKNYARVVSARDLTNLVDTQVINIAVIEINHKPAIGNIGVRTVWTQGDESTFYHQTQISDVEDGNQLAGNLTLNLTFLNNAPKLFNISANGTMFFTPNVSEISAGVYNLSVYNISLCVKDKGLIAVHPNIIICGQNGGIIENCLNFSLTITNENRAPIITSHNPFALNFSAPGEQNLYFNISIHDPDGTIPDVYWFVDNSLVKYDSMISFSELNHAFGCGVSGWHSIKAEATDGLLNGSVIWNASIQQVSCPTSPQTGGGGGGGFNRCSEKWTCLDWNVCQNVENSLSSGLISNEDFDTISENCRIDSFGDSCGLQIRGCSDINSCNRTASRPQEIGHCYYVENPGCSDGVKNCHSGGCELLVDCGGPCGACPTCSDGIKNQGELGKDCEGPCPLQCPAAPPLGAILKIQYILGFLALAFLVIVIIQIIRIYKARKIIQGQT